MSLFSKSKKRTALHFHELCRDFYEEVTEMELSPEEVMELCTCATAILSFAAVNYYHDPLDLRDNVVRTLNGTISMLDVEHGSIH